MLRSIPVTFEIAETSVEVLNKQRAVMTAKLVIQSPAFSHYREVRTLVFGKARGADSPVQFDSIRAAKRWAEVDQLPPAEC